MEAATTLSALGHRGTHREHMLRKPVIGPLTRMFIDFTLYSTPNVLSSQSPVRQFVEYWSTEHARRNGDLQALIHC